MHTWCTLGKRVFLALVKGKSSDEEDETTCLAEMKEKAESSLL